MENRLYEPFPECTPSKCASPNVAHVGCPFAKSTTVAEIPITGANRLTVAEKQRAIDMVVAELDAQEKPYRPDGSANLVAGRRKAGRPAKPVNAASTAQAKRVARAQTKLVMERAAQLGVSALSEPRTPLRFDAPERTVTQAKEAALKLLNQMLWTLEQRVAEAGVNEYDEQRLLKLLAGLNAALPKQAENPQKDPSEMTEEELRRLAGK